MSEPQTDVGQAVRDRAARLLMETQPALPLTLGDAREVVRFLRPRRVGAGTCLMRAGDPSQTDFMVLVIDGEVRVENHAHAGDEGMVVTVLGPGSLIGTMGLIDGAPRSATCVATTDLAVGVLTRVALLDLIRERPNVGAKLLLTIAKQLADDLREANRKLVTLTQVGRAQQQELDAVHAVNRRLIEAQGQGRVPPVA